MFESAYGNKDLVNFTVKSISRNAILLAKYQDFTI